MREITFAQATLEAMDEEMSRDERVFVSVSYTHLDVYKRQEDREPFQNETSSLYRCMPLP